MDSITPQLKKWIELRRICIDLFGEENVYEVVPPKEAVYPFIHMNTQFKNDTRIHKDYLTGETQITVNVWHNDTDLRGTLATMMGNIETGVRMKYKRNLLEANTQIITDNSTGKELLHGIIEFNIKY